MLIRDLPAAAQRMAIALLLQSQAFLRWRPDRFTLLLTALALLGAALILARQVNYGVGFHIDSIFYMSVARHLLEGEGFVTLTNKDLYVSWAPLYPLLLAAASLFVFDPYAVAGPLNAAIFGLTIFVAGHYLRQRIHSRFLILWTCLAILLSIPLTSIAYLAMSEAPFILFVTLSLFHTDYFLHQGKRASLLWAAVFTALACLTRYIGPALIFTVLPLLLSQRNTGFGTKMKHIAAYTLISVFPIALWMLRNFLLSEMPTGHFLVAESPTVSRFFITRFSTNMTLPNLLDFMLNTLSRWVLLDLPLGEFHSFAVALTGLALLALAIAVGVTLRAQQKGGTWTNWSPFCIFGSFTLVYLFSLLGSTATLAGEPPNNRYLSPVYIPFLFTAVFVMDRFLLAEQQRKLLGTLGHLPLIRTIVQGRVKHVSLLTVLLSAVLSLWLGRSVPINARAIRQANAYIGPDRGIAGSADSEVFQYMREHSIDDAIMTNTKPWLVYWYTDAAAYYHFNWSAPMVAAPYSDPYTDNYHISDKIRQFIVNTDDVYLVWFYDGFHTPNLDVLPELEPVADLEDGVILKVNKTYGNADAYRAITASQPIVRSNFDLHLNDNTLHYVRDTCRPDDIQARFFLHIIPHDTNDLPQQQQQYGFDNLDFAFYEHGVRFNGKCLASVPLPDYPIVYIKTGQRIPSGEDKLWQGESILNGNNAYGAEAYQSIVAGQAVLRAHFDIYLNDNTLHYVRDTCRPNDIQARFFLHILPHDTNDLPQHRQQYGFDNLDFAFYEHVVRFDGKCLASVPLPDYPIARINTGQWIPDEGRIWEGEFPFPKE